MNNARIKAKFETLHSQRKVVEEMWQAIERFVAPYRGKFFRESSGETGIEWQQRDIYDSTAVMAHQSLASSMHGSLTNPAVRWFELQWREKDLKNNHAAQEWIENAGNKVYNTLQDSNFNLEINETYRDLTSFGTSFLLQEPRVDMSQPWQGIDFTSVPLKEGYFEPDEKGQCREFYRLMRWRASKIVAKFGADKVPDKVKSNYDQASDEQHDVIFCVYPSDAAKSTDRLLTPENRQWTWKYIDRQQPDHVYASGGYYEMPAYAPRWLTTSESVWGNSPATVALADILTLNQLVQLELKALEKVVDPAILAQERALINDLDLGPGSINKVRDPDQIKIFESKARFDVTQLKVADLRGQINRYFFIDQLELKESPAMTATEVQVRYELMQRLLAATLSRLRHDMLDPLVSRTFNLLLRAGELGDPPEGINPDYDVEYIGPLSRAQRFDQSASLERWLTQLQMIASISPKAEEVLMVPDWQAVARASARNLNLPVDLTRDPADVTADIDKDKQAQARQSNADASAMEASAAKDITQAEQMRGSQDPNIGKMPT